MTAVLDPTDVHESAELAELGIHRDPSSADQRGSGSWTTRLVDRASSWLAGRTTTRRTFLTRTAVVGSALAVGPIDFILKPGSAYGYVCGGCTDGWTAFCCSINAGRNSCPAGSFVAGWWKADNAAYCCGSARYILDCNATCPTQCSCRCTSGDSCDRRRTCCAQFRYGQCNQQIACYGPVVCRVATCVPPWQYDTNCTTASATDNRTRDHGANCLNETCDTPIDRRYAALGGASSPLGRQVAPERAVTGGDAQGGRVAFYENGNIYWTQSTGAHGVWGRIYTEFRARGGIGGVLRYPTSAILSTPDGRTRYQQFQGGRIYSFQQGRLYAVTLTTPFQNKHWVVGGVTGVMGYPRETARPINHSRGGTVQGFERGRMYQRPGAPIFQTHGSFADLHQAHGGIGGRYGHPVTDVMTVDGGRGRTQWFQGGLMWSRPSTGLSAKGVWGVILDRYLTNGHITGNEGQPSLGYPTETTRGVGDGRGTFGVFERGRIYGTVALGAFQVHGGILTEHLARGGPTGSLGYPTSELDPPGPGTRRQTFEGGTIERLPDGTIQTV